MAILDDMGVSKLSAKVFFFLCITYYCTYQGLVDGFKIKKRW